MSKQLTEPVPALSGALREASLRYRLAHMWDLVDTAAVHALVAKLADPSEKAPKRSAKLLESLRDMIELAPAHDRTRPLTAVFVWATALQGARGEAGEVARAAAGHASLQLALKVRAHCVCRSCVH